MTVIDYAALGQTDEEAALLAEHDRDEDLHEYVGYDDPYLGFERCKTCGDTSDGLMHNNTWRNVEPLMADE